MTKYLSRPGTAVEVENVRDILKNKSRHIPQKNNNPNKFIIFELIKKHGPLTKGQICKKLKMSIRTVEHNMERLMMDGLLEKSKCSCCEIGFMFTAKKSSFRE